MIDRPLVIAHGAGNRPETLAAAAAHADVLEADVHLYRGRLEVRHAKALMPLPLLWEGRRLLPRERRPLELATVLAAVPPEARLMLDLKGPDPRLGAAVIAAAGDFAAARGLFVSARVWRTADRMRGVPGVRTLHSAGSERQLAALLRRYGPGELEGVAVHRRLLTPGRASVLRGRAPALWSWPVDDPETARRLAAWGVTGLISDAPAQLVRASPAPVAGAAGP